MLSIKFLTIGAIFLGIAGLLIIIRFVLIPESHKKLPKGYIYNLRVLNNPGKDKALRTLNLITIFIIISTLSSTLLIFCSSFLFQIGK